MSALGQILAPMSPEDQVEHLRALVDDLSLVADVLGQPWPDLVQLRPSHCRIVRRLCQGPATMLNIGAAMYADRADWLDWTNNNIHANVSILRRLLREAEIAELTRAIGGATYELQLLPGAPPPWAHLDQ